MNKALKNVGAVVAGFLVVVVLSVVTDAILEALGVFPGGTLGTGLLALAFLYRSLYTVLGGYVTACLSPLPSRKNNVIALGILGTLGGIMGVVAGWNLSEHWYPIALAVTAFPFVWLGGKLKMK